MAEGSCCWGWLCHLSWECIYLAPIVLIASVSISQAASANALVIEGTKRVASSVAAKVVISGVVRAANSQTVHDFGVRRSAQARARMLQNFSRGSGISGEAVLSAELDSQSGA